MIVYNVTVSVDDSILVDWLSWIQEIHIPKIMNTGLFVETKIHRVIEGTENHNTFAIAYTCRSIKDLKNYQLNYASDLQREHLIRYQDKALAFRTVLEVVAKF